LGENQAGRTDVKFFVRRMWAGSALENAVARDPEVLADSNITHLGTAAGREASDFVIGDNYNIDVTGNSRTSITDHMSRNYYQHPDQILTYSTLTPGEVATIYGKAGAGG
jgi:hypothetical protein